MLSPPTSVIFPVAANAVAESAFPVKAPTKVVDVILTPPVYVPAVPENVPSDKVPACIVPEIVTSLFKSIVTIPLVAATAAAVTVIFESPLNSKSSVDKFKAKGPVASPA